MFGPGNLGDEAMLVAALKSLPKRRCIRWTGYVRQRAILALIRRRVRRHLLVGGGTLIHGGDTGWLDYVEMRSRQGSHVAFFGTGIAFTQDQIANESSAYKRWRSVLERSNEIHLRGPRSVALCRQMGVPADVFGDFAFLLHRSDIPVRNHNERCEVVGINVGECLGDQASFESTISAVVRRLSARFRLVFHVVVSGDMDATRRVIRAAGLSADSCSIERHYFDPDAFMQSIRGYRAFVGLKLHAAGLAMVAGVPSVMIAYRDKSYDFMEPLSAGDEMIIGLPLDAEAFNAKVDKLLDAPGLFTVEEEIARVAELQRGCLARVFGCS